MINNIVSCKYGIYLKLSKNSSNECGIKKFKKIFMFVFIYFNILLSIWIRLI